MNIIKQIKLYREVKDYVIKTPRDIRMGSIMSGVYGDLTTYYEINMGDLALTAYKESDMLGAKEHWVAVKDTKNIGADSDICSGMVAKAIYNNIRNAYNQRYATASRFGIGR